MSKEEILDYFYNTVTYTRAKEGWRTDFNVERIRGIKLGSDLINAKTGKVVAEAGTKMTPRLARKLAESGLKEIRVPTEELVGLYIASDLVNEEDRKSTRLNSIH